MSVNNFKETDKKYFNIYHNLILQHYIYLSAARKVPNVRRVKCDNTASLKRFRMCIGHLNEKKIIPYISILS